MKRQYRGLSPLLATLLLLAFTLVGAVFVYEYFNRAMDLAVKQGETLLITAQEYEISGSTKLVTLDILNAHKNDVVIKDVIEYSSTGEKISIPVDPRDAVIPAGAKKSIVVVVSANARALIVRYEVEGLIMEKTVPLAG